MSQNRASRECEKQVIADHEDFRAQICPCGVIHVSMGPMTLRFTRASFEIYFQFMRQLREHLIRTDRHSIEEGAVVTHPSGSSALETWLEKMGIVRGKAGDVEA
jgi:hypothetical protein